VRRAAALVILALLLAVAYPVGQVMRAAAPPATATHRLGTGRLLGSVLTGPFRPLLLTYLWMRADILYGQGRFDECFQLYRFILQLYPNNAAARDFVGWMAAFNLKSEAPADKPAVGWSRAEFGLDILRQVPDGPSWIADWIRMQCGQNSVSLERYAGPEWEIEKEWRRRLRPWGARWYDEDLGRFELGLKVLEGRTHLFDRARRAQLLEALAYEELLRHGEAPHAAEAVAALDEMAKEFADDPSGTLGPALEQRARQLETLSGGGIVTRTAPETAYPAAMALWGTGVARGDPDRLAAAERLLEELSPGHFNEERALLRAWRAHVQDPDTTPRPPLPFDGRP